MQTFFTGDLVKYIGSNGSWKKGREHIIHECVYRRQGKFYYSTNLGAWFDSEEFQLIKKVTEQTLKQLDEDLNCD